MTSVEHTYNVVDKAAALDEDGVDVRWAAACKGLRSGSYYTGILELYSIES